ncbi:MAG: DUF402 domain-containing protein [bacterium]|nr:DUF402 domain-containing protein [bacterium]
MSEHWKLGDPVVRREVLHGRVWSGMPMYVVADDSDLLALYTPTDSQIGFAPGNWPTPDGRHPWDSGPDTRWQGHGVLHLHRPYDAYAVWVFWHGQDRRFTGWYLNLQKPYQRTSFGIDTLDHELDIVVGVNGDWRFKDADLLEECVEARRFSRVEADTILAEGHRLGQMLDDGKQWWDRSWSTWTPPPQWDVPLMLPADWAR